MTNEFTVSASVDTVWATLLDMESVGGCLPGATIEPSEDDNTYNGSMKLKIGPMTVTYKGSATFTEVDAPNRRAVIALRAREAKGQGTAMATITNVLEQHNGGTRVRAETDLHVTGAQARFGRGVMEDVAERVLEEFSARLEQQLAGAQTRAATAQEVEPAPDALNVGAVLSKTRVGRALRVAVAVLVIAIVVAVILLIGR